MMGAEENHFARSESMRCCALVHRQQRERSHRAWRSHSLLLETAGAGETGDLYESPSYVIDSSAWPGTSKPARHAALVTRPRFHGMNSGRASSRMLEGRGRKAMLYNLIFIPLLPVPHSRGHAESARVAGDDGRTSEQGAEP